MMPPIVRRCPECGHITWNRRFTAVVTDTGRQFVECPSCNHRFRPIDDPWLN
jgi:ribosomal protein L32